MTIPKEAFHQTIRDLLGPISDLLDQADVTEVMCQGHHRIFARQNGRSVRSERCLPTEENLLAVLRAVSQYAGRQIDTDRPTFEGTLPDGSRVQAIVPPLAMGAPLVVFSRVQLPTLSVNASFARGATFSSLLRQAMSRRENILVAGLPGAGKTALLRALAALVPDDERVLVVEHTPELYLDRDNAVSLVGSGSSASLEEILAFGSRMRPDRILVGDLRGSEALALVDLATAGFAGCISTIQAPSASAALRRLEFFASKAAGEVPVSLLRSHIASGLDLIVLVDRSPDGEPRIAEVVRLDEAEEHDVYRLQTQSGERREPNGKEAE